MIAHNRQHDPDFHKPPDELPYGVFICDDENQTQILFDYSYRPMWKRCGENPAVRADPTAWFDWCEVYWLYDRSLIPLPKNYDLSPRNRSSNTEARLCLREALVIVLAEFVSGGTPLVRQWRQRRPDLAGTLIGKVVQRLRTDPKSGLKVIENLEVN
jgi:hypothetical protein